MSLDIDTIKNNIFMYTNVLCRFGSVWALDILADPEEFMQNIEQFSENWVKYNPNKDSNRYGLSVTSLNGDLSGIPDLDSLKEYNKKQNTAYREEDFIKPTPVYPFAKRWIPDELAPHICRTHLIKLKPGGFFPMHRDNNLYAINTFRLLVPIKNCNPPMMFFIIDRETIYFEHGRMYFINTCLEHALFNPSLEDATMMVVNVLINKESIDFVLKHKAIT